MEQLMLFSDRISTHYLRGNQLRLYFSSIASVLLQMLRRLGLHGTEWACPFCQAVRNCGSPLWSYASLSDNGVPFCIRMLMQVNSQAGSLSLYRRESG